MKCCLGCGAEGEPEPGYKLFACMGCLDKFLLALGRFALHAHDGGDPLFHAPRAAAGRVVLVCQLDEAAAALDEAAADLRGLNDDDFNQEYRGAE